MRKLYSILLISFAVIHISTVKGQNFVRVTRANQEQIINLSTGQVLEIRLPRKAATGYIWCPPASEAGEAASANGKSKSIAQIGESDFIYDAASVTHLKHHIVGQSGTQIIRFVGVSQGTTVLTLELKRPWVKNAEVMDSYTITVVSTGKYTGTYTPSLKTIRQYSKPLTSAASTLPASWDWRPQCTPIKDQGICGDCWAYASVGSLECNILIHDGITRDISEEFVTDCYTADSCSGCSGGNCPNQVWVASYKGANSEGGGAIYESEDPTTCNNTGITGTCGAPYAPHEAIESYRDIGGEDSTTEVPPVDSIKYHIYYHGPVWVAVNAKHWVDNCKGIWVETNFSDTTDHAVCLVGWKDTLVSDSSGGYWILRNSYSTSWGNNGYLYISYGSDCVGANADYIDYKGGTNSGINSYTVNRTNDILIYPNPANDIITIEENSLINKNGLISIYNIQGQIVLEQTLQDAKSQIDISSLEKGVYFVKVNNRNGMQVRKVVKD